MTLNPKQIQDLKEPLDKSRVKSRQKGSKTLSYLEAHDVIRRANEIFGVGSWGYEVVPDSLVCLAAEPVVRECDSKSGYRVGYRAIVQVSIDGHTAFSDVGYGDAVEYTGSAITPHELAAKEAVSDGVKRALKNYGDQFGLCLYAKDDSVVISEYKNTSQNSGGDYGDPGEYMINFGKNKSKSIRTVYESEPSYLQWILNTMKPTNQHGRELQEAVKDFLAWVENGEPLPVDPDDDIPF